jgi:hypothetical protein
MGDLPAARTIFGLEEGAMASTGSLTADEVAAYAEQGFLIPRFQMGAKDTTRLRDDVLAVVEAHSDFRTRPVMMSHMPRPEDNFPSLMPFCLRAEILDMIESLQGPDLMLWSTSVFHRPAGEDDHTPWHQDGNFWPMQPLAATSVWIALSHCRPESGGLRVIEGSHKRQAPHVASQGANIFTDALAPEALEEDKAVDIELEPGQMLLFDPKLIHSSHPNRSRHDRTAFAIRYSPTTSFFDLDGGTLNAATGRRRFADAALFMVRGVNRNPRNDFERNKR